MNDIGSISVIVGDIGQSIKLAGVLRMLSRETGVALVVIIDSGAGFPSSSLIHSERSGQMGRRFSCGMNWTSSLPVIVFGSG